MRHATLKLTVVRLLVPLATLSAQSPLPIQPGTQIFRGDTVILDTTECPLASVTRLDVHRGRHGHPWRGALFGVLTGRLIGMMIGQDTEQCKNVGWEPCGWLCFNGPRDWRYKESCTTDMSLASTIAMFGGAAVGLVVGAFTKTDRWEEVPLDRLRVSIVPQRDGRFALGVSVSF